MKLALEATAYVNGVSFSALYTANGDGSSPFQIATSPSWCNGPHGSCTQTHYHKFDADWSAGGQLVYTLDDTAIVVSAADGSGRKILFASTDGVRQPRWGAGDRTITYLASSTGYMYSMQSADGSDVRLLSSLSVEQHGWAPDGSSIAVQGYIGNTIDDHALFLVNPATGQTTRIVQASGPGFAWSPLGDELAIEKADSLFVVDRRGNPTFVFKGDFVNPVWSPDGRYFIGRKNDALDGAVIEISRARGSRRVVVSGGSIANISVEQSTRWNGYFDLFF